MLLNLGGPLVASHAAIYPLLPHAGSVSPERLMSPGRLRSRRRTRPGSALGPRFLHPSGIFPDGVPSSLFKLQPRSTTTTSPAPRPPSPPGGSGEVEELATAVAITPTVAEEVMEAFDVRLAEEADLPDISALLADVRSKPFVVCRLHILMCGCGCFRVTRQTVVSCHHANGTFSSASALVFCWARPKVGTTTYIDYLH